MDLQFLTADEVAEVRAFEEMFGTEGWKRYVQKHRDAIDLLPQRAIAAANEKELFIIKGQFAIMKQLVDYEDFYNTSIALLIQDRQVERDRAVEDAVEERISHAQGL
jgi:hypothetical protein